MKALKVSIAVLLCGLILYNSLGYWMVFSFVQSKIKDHAFATIAHLPEKSLIPITLPINNTSRLIQKKNRLEIKLDGQMYDVVKSRINGNNITYYCIRDIKEERMIQKIGLLNRTGKNELPLRKTALLIIDHVIKTALINGNLTFSNFSVKFKNVAQTIVKYSAPLILIPAPPPQF